MRHKLLAAAALVALTACGQQQAPTTAAEAPPAPKSGIALENMDTSVRPGDDFFSFVNGKWIAETEIPADKATYGGFGILADEAEEDVKAIIEQSASGDFAKGTDEQKVGDLYKSYLDIETRNAKGVAPLEPELERIAAIEDHEALAVYFAAAGRRGYPVPVNIGQVADFKDPNYYMIYAWQSGLGLPDREYYFKDDEASADIRRKYVEHIEAMFDLAGFEDGAAAATAIMALETRIAAAHITKEAARDWPNNYNKVALDKLNDVMPAFNWPGYIDEAGIGAIDGLVLMMTSYFEALDPVIAETPIETWQTYLKWVALNSKANALNAALDDQDFQFYGKTLSGREQQREPWRRAVNTVNGLLGEVVGKVYVKEHFPPEAKERMLELVGNLIKAYEKSITELDWMSDETRAQALDKLSKFRPKIGYPDVWRDYSAVDIEADDLFGNIERATLAEYERELARQGGPVDREEWGMTPQTVNAYYMPPLNEIVFPAAILQPPFFNMEADDAVNYGAIGAVIGHEIGHGFDDKGSTFDGDGVMRNWWTDADRSEFDARTAKLVDQYGQYAPFQDLAVNGEFTLGENIGDLGGISIGLLAYEMSLDGAEPPVIDGFTGIQRVFLGYGQIWRNKYRDEALRQLIMTDPHAPSMYRANGAVRNVPEFYEAFDVKEGDALYLPPEQRVKIW
ncbi:MAG TPA: M13-type metalloendopeptidase [Woeseiaceae bacterium]|nr:M13-type metalloendopeptidase [Woeseiaceae bacterium]